MTKEEQNKPPPTAPHVYTAIAAIAADMSKDGIAKNRNNQQQNYKFRGIDDVYNALAPILAKNSLVILPQVLERTVVERQTQKGATLFYVTLKVQYDFVSAIDGSKHSIVTYGEAMDSADKATNKAMSASYKYGCMLTFCIPTEGDNDADATTHEPAPRKAVGAPPEKKADAKPLDAKQQWIKQQRDAINAMTSVAQITAWQKQHDTYLKALSEEQYKFISGIADRKINSLAQAPLSTNGAAHAGAA
jgi:hypothetical protein